MTPQERKVMEQALEALKTCTYTWKECFVFSIEKVEEAVIAVEKALAQPEQICGFDVVIDELMPPDTFKLAQPEQEYHAVNAVHKGQQCYVKAQPEQEPDIWVLTSEYNDDDQHGEYFEAVFIGKPTSEQIQKHCRISEEGAVRILSGGGRVNNECLWYNLQKTQAAHGIKE